VKQVTCVHLRHWPIDRLRRRRFELRRKPFILVETTANRQIVTAVSPDVPPTVRPGMTLAQARAHCDGLAIAEAQPDKDRRSLEALGYWLMQFSPNVAICPQSSICLDATGLELLFGSLHTLAGQIDAALKRLQLSANVVIAPTPGAAWAMAVFGNQSPIVVSNETLVAALSRLPPDALRLEPRATESLHALGISTIGLLLRIPRDQLVSRFGPAILQRIDQATGTVQEPLNWLPQRAPIQAELEFDGIVESLETLHLALRQVLDQVVKLLIDRGLGAKQLRLTLRRPYAPPMEKTLGLVRSSRHAAGLFNLLRHVLESMETDEGFNAICLTVSCAERLGNEQASLIGDDTERNAAELDHLIERLHAKFGDVAQWAELVESHLPERAVSYRNESTTIEKKLLVPSRPLCLFPCPREIPVIVMPSESRDGQPVSFTHNNQVHRLIHVRGPERIAGQRWSGSGKTRDYFDVADTNGNRFWLFRVMETNRWYLHGVFE
jgi:protein ImuB